MKLRCEVCDTNPSAFTLPSETGKEISICAPCAEQMFIKIMQEKTGATLQ